MTAPSELPDELYEKIQSHCAKGEAFLEADDLSQALKEYRRAWDLIPTPKEIWPAATWVLVAIGDAYFLAGDIEKSYAALGDAVRCAEGFGNPFIHMRLGQALYELGDLDASAEELIRAYALEGPAVFEHEDAKYLKFLKTRAAL
jgi:tetratricopeptide (TPR) repeat protein